MTPRATKKVIHRDGTVEAFKMEEIIKAIQYVVEWSKVDDPYVSVVKILKNFELKLPNEVTTDQIDELLLKAVETLISEDTGYDKIASKQLAKIINKRIDSEISSFGDYIQFAVKEELLDARLLDFDLGYLEHQLKYENDDHFNYFGLSTLHNRYLTKDRDQKVIEKPQRLWMRVAMWLSLLEENKEEFTLKVYNQLSNFRYIHATPTLYNSWLTMSQLSSCYINVVPDDMDGIMSKVKEIALYAKYAWWAGTAISKIRASGSLIKSINAKSSGPIPFIKIFDVTINSIMQWGRRRSNDCMYMEPRHYNFMDFLELKDTNGSPYLRTPSLNTACWIPDEFMERAEKDLDRYFFDPAEAPELYQTRGKEFSKHYQSYIKKAEAGEVRLWKKDSAKKIYDKILYKLAKTGNYRLNFKDRHNEFNQAPNYSIIHSSNLCTEISIPNHEWSTAVCTLASINLSKQLTKEYTKLSYKEIEKLSIKQKLALIDRDAMESTIGVIVRALDNAMTLNFYPTPESKQNTMDLRPMGMWLMGLAELYIMLGIEYDSKDALTVADKIGAFMKKNALANSEALGEERGPFDHYDPKLYDYKPRRNAILMSIQPTASTSLIMGTSSTVDPYFANVYSRETLSGQFTIVINQLVEQLKEQDLWDEDMKNEIVGRGGSIQHIDALDGKINKNLFKTSYETWRKAQIDIAATLQKHIDQAISRNMYITQEQRSDMPEIYNYAWKSWLKGTYYCFIEKKLQWEKYTQSVNKRGERKWFSKAKETTEAVATNETTETQKPRWFGRWFAKKDTPVATQWNKSIEQIDLKNVSEADKVLIEKKLVEEKGEEYVAQLKAGKLYDWCPVDPFEAVMCESCQ